MSNVAQLETDTYDRYEQAGMAAGGGSRYANGEWGYSNAGSSWGGTCCCDSGTPSNWDWMSSYSDYCTSGTECNDNYNYSADWSESYNDMTKDYLQSLTWLSKNAWGSSNPYECYGYESSCTYSCGCGYSTTSTSYHYDSRDYGCGCDCDYNEPDYDRTGFYEPGAYVSPGTFAFIPVDPSAQFNPYYPSSQPPMKYGFSWDDSCGNGCNDPGSIYGYGIAWQGKNVNGEWAQPVESLQIGPSTALPTMPGSSGEGGEEGDNPRSVTKAGFDHWASYDTFELTPIPKPTTLDRILVTAGEWYDYLTSFATLENLQFTLDIVSMVPYVGAPASLVNASIYAYNGNYSDALLRVAFAVPGLGVAGGVAKASAKGLKVIGASVKTAEMVGCAFGASVNVAAKTYVVLNGINEGNKALEKGNYLEAMVNYAFAGLSLKGIASKYCFTEGTQVVVGAEYDADGVFVSYVTQNIEDIKIGDLVYSYDTATGEVSQKAVISTSALKSDHINYLTIVDEDGNEQVIETTDTHPFWIVTDEPDLERAARELADGFYHENIAPGLGGFWVEAKDLRVGDVFLGANGELSMLKNIVRVEQEGGINVFNFTVEGKHNYFILAKEYEYGQTCVLVHNTNCDWYTGTHNSGGAKNLRQLGLGGVNLKGKSYKTGKKLLEEKGFTVKEITKTGRVTFENSKGTLVHFDSGKALEPWQKNHWHINSNGGLNFSAKGLIVDSSSRLAHIKAR